jgi:Fic family protein
VLAFGFVYIHPFADGNGRKHDARRIEAALRQHMVDEIAMDAVSAAILERIDDYRRVLEDYSRRLLPLIQWEPTKGRNVTILNDTAD